MGRVRVGVLISGRGSNMAALIEAAKEPSYPAEIALVLANKPDATGLDFAAANAIACETIDHRRFSERAAFDAEVDACLRRHRIEFVCLAGFMRLLTPGFVAAWHDRLINIHPSLLPAYPGLDTHKRALADGVRLAGCTVHYVRAQMDTGPAIAQAAVAVLPDDNEAALAARVLAAEHLLYPHALRLALAGAPAGPVGAPDALFNPPL